MGLSSPLSDWVEQIRYRSKIKEIFHLTVESCTLNHCLELLCDFCLQGISHNAG